MGTNREAAAGLLDEQVSRPGECGAAISRVGVGVSFVEMRWS